MFHNEEIQYCFQIGCYYQNFYFLLKYLSLNQHFCVYLNDIIKISGGLGKTLIQKISVVSIRTVATIFAEN